MSKRNSRNMVILLLCFVMVSIGVGFSFLQSSIVVTGSASTPTTDWKLSITDVSVCTLNDQIDNVNCRAITGDASNIMDDTKVDDTDALKVNFGAKLVNVGDSITYKVTVKNEGSLPAKFTSIKFDKLADETMPVAFSYLNLEENETLKSGETKTFYIMASYLEDTPITSNTFTNAASLTYAVAK